MSPLDDGCNWRVLEDFHYDTDVELSSTFDALKRRQIDVYPFTKRTNGWRVNVPKGFITDFASIPRPLWFFVGGPSEGKYRKIAVVHDFLYRTPGLCTRRQADAVLMEGMKVSGVSWFTRWQVYLGVRLGGHSSYKGGL